MGREGKIESSDSSIEAREYVIGTINKILERKYEEAETEEQVKIWKQPAELYAIVDYWNDFDKETQDLIISAIPEVSIYLLKKKLLDSFSLKKSK